MSYPKINDKNFNKAITRKFSKFRIPDKTKTFREICFPNKFKHQLPQKFVSEFINPQTPYKGLLVYHRIGAGKTCSGVNICEQWKKKRKILVVVPAALIGNFRKELRSQCAFNEYLSSEERDELQDLHPLSKEYKAIIKKSDARINKYYTILSYHKFVELANKRKINLKKTLMLIDEVQNMISESGTFYTTLLKTIQNAPDDLRLILLSATPMFDKPGEIGLTMNLLRIPKPFPTGSAFNDMFLKVTKNCRGEKCYAVKNMNKFKNMVKGYISYFRGAPPKVFPTANIKYKKCYMSDFQYKSYRAVAHSENYSRKYGKDDILNLPNNFFIGSRIISNVAFPNQKTNHEGYVSMKSKHMQLQNLKKYSIKFYKIIREIKRAKGPVFVYSNFKEYGGIKSFVKVLKANGYKDYENWGEGVRRFAIWSGDCSMKYREEIKVVFNNKNNSEGGKIKIMLGSPSIKEGVSLLRVSQVHVMEPYWNMSRLEQIIGRAVRYCSHKDMPRDRRFVDVYIYLAVHKKYKNTVDKYIYELAKKKDSLISQFELAMKEAAVDCQLNKNANVSRHENDIKCLA